MGGGRVTTPKNPIRWEGQSEKRDTMQHDVRANGDTPTVLLGSWSHFGGSSVKAVFGFKMFGVQRTIITVFSLYPVHRPREIDASVTKHTG